MEDATTMARLQAARAGSEADLAAIITCHTPFIRSVAGKAVRPGLDFDDAVQEGIIGLFRSIENYEPSREVSFATYARVCIHNAILSAQKAAGRKKHAPLNYSVPIPANQSIPGPEESAIASEQVDLVMQRARARLSPLEIKVLVLHLDGLPYEKIARSLGKTPKAVENALARARRKMR